ncbi:hypothetical protein [Lichenihabitans psoromatis]|uniref:hypothetical protein n=1 Tax=Lichenihabitans psoromatis TaxID=2528642 RepID=UPI00103556C6|nr:hypothetical protein [Lichenihabitans psoromatis]
MTGGHFSDVLDDELRRVTTTRALRHLNARDLADPEARAVAYVRAGLLITPLGADDLEAVRRADKLIKINAPVLHVRDAA